MIATRSVWSIAIKLEHDKDCVAPRKPGNAFSNVRKTACEISTNSSITELEHWRRERVGNAFNGSIAVDSQPLLVHPVSAGWIS